ncbi:hypothetical protein CHS0354_001242 [Potamilus streckersoni]|uniref:RBR-type E3 ubiquitin transferase n=1 Tax=Potamilus streckersoni TaxID=2493646 RepID=A0AAE0S3C6_9BIVA|nr:hypothetical protein CHS0354_001242 [Potamilus streckersoni]
MNELRTILKRDLREDILFEFRLVEEADPILKKVLIETLKQNVCCFLGHEKAGYFNLVNHQHVQIHPSSVLKPLDLHPELIVYEQVLQTSADFVTNITPINEEEMILLPSEVLDIYKSTKDKICVSLKQTYWAGQKVLKQFIGPLHQNRREIEGRLSIACENRTVVLDANKITGKIQLYCCKVDEQLTVRMLEDVLDGLTKSLLQKCVEVPVGKTDGGVRVVLGAGAEVINILMPYQYRTLFVKQKLQSDKEIEISDVEKVFSLYGEITDIKPFVKKDGKDPSYWGTVTFMRDIDATNAVALLTSSANRFYEAIPQLPRINSNISRDFKVKLTWWRRRGKGIAYVKMAWPEDFVMALAAESVTIDGYLVSIQQSSDNDTHDTTNQLYLKGLQYNILEEDIRASFKRFFGLSNRIKHIVIPRETSETSKQMYNALCEKIERIVSQYAPRGSFDITFVPDPVKNQKCIQYTVFVSFSNPNQGQTALNGMRINPPSFGVYPVHVTAELETSITIWKNVYEAVKSEIEPTIEFIMSQNPNVSVKTNTSRAGNVFLNINSNDAGLLGHVKALLHDVVQADILECGRNKEIARLFTRDGRCEVKRIEKETGAVIFVDNRTMSVSIQGTQTRRTEALSHIIKYLDTLADLLEIQLQLRGDGKPRGVMKELISKYGTDLEQMKEHTGVKSLKLDLRNHQITVLGDQDSIDKMKKLLQEICCNLADIVHHEPSELPDCPVCMCPVEPSSMYHLEYCGHPYCSECIKNLLKSAIQDKIFPILCVAESCKQPLVIEDFTALIQQGCTTQRDLMKSSLSLFVSKNNTQFRYCITPDCQMVYRITAEGTPFACSECQQRICTACHIQYHNGLTCSMYLAEKRDENKIVSWLRKDRVNRKLCPKCSAPIEKNGGCNHMECESCHVHFCWVCLKTFSSGSDCNGHLHSVHNSIWPEKLLTSQGELDLPKPLPPSS